MQVVGSCCFCHLSTWSVTEREREGGEGGDYILSLIQSYLHNIYPANFTLVKLEGVEPIKLTIQGARFSNFRDKEIIFG